MRRIRLCTPKYIVHTSHRTTVYREQRTLDGNIGQVRNATWKMGPDVERHANENGEHLRTAAGSDGSERGQDGGARPDRFFGRKLLSALSYGLHARR